MKLILMGPPASGKGTVSEKLEKDFDFLHVSAGELLREEVAKGTTIGKEIDEIMKKGDLVPSKLIAEMVKLTVKDEEGYILDGFPRSLEQAEYIEDLEIDAAIYLEVPEDVVIERFAGRRMCQKCNHGYHLKYLPPKEEGICDKDGSELIQREDDKPETVKKRFQVYHENTQPLIEFYKNKGKLITVDGAPAPDVVYASVKEEVEKLKNK